jgi:hypothetical protein
MAIVDARALARKLDAPASSWTPEKLHLTFLKYGCAVVRGAIDRSVQGKVKQAIDNAYLQKPDETHVYDPDIAVASKDGVSGWELVDTPLLQGFLRLAFSGQDWRRLSVTARRIQGVGQDKNWQPPLELHLDSQFHGPTFTINFWAPFDPCGVDAPSLQLVPLDYRSTRAWASYTGKALRENEKWYFGYFRPDLADLESATAAFGPDCFLRPAMQPGDLIISSNWIIHGSYRTPQMTKGRTNAELRFIGSSLDLGKGSLFEMLGRTFQKLAG